MDMESSYMEDFNIHPSWLGYLKQLVFTRTRLEFRFIWNKLFQKEDDEVAWLLNPHKQSTSRPEATMMMSFNKNIDGDSYQYGRDYNRSLSLVRGPPRRDEGKKSFGESALEVARYMGMGVYMTSTSFPSPFLPVNDACLYNEAIFDSPHGMYSWRDY